MDNGHRNSRITLSISTRANRLLEELQQHQRKLGSRRFKSQIIHEALTGLAQGLGLEHENDGEQSVEDDVVTLDFFAEGDVAGEGSKSGCVDEKGAS
jgi:hypothetical protein